MLKLHQFNMDKLFIQLKTSLSKESTQWINNSEKQRMMMDHDDDEYVAASDRDEIVAYLQEVCERDDMLLSLETFALSTTLLDRFLASFKVRSKYLECAAVACLYIACKVREEDENVSVTSEFLIDCDCRCSIAELLRMEQMILKKFDWSVDDITAADFLYIYYAIAINKWNDRQHLVKPININRWKTIENQMPQKPINNSKSNEVSRFYSPEEFDCLHILEHKIKQCLCVSELTTTFKPHLIAYVLLELEIDRLSAHNSELKKICTSIRLMYVKETNEEIAECKRLIKLHLKVMESTNSLLDKFLRDNKMFDRTRSRAYRSSRAMMLNSFSTELSDIEEEEIEEEEEDHENEIFKKRSINISNDNYARILSDNTSSASNIIVRNVDRQAKKKGEYRKIEAED